jgi:hypothetical protein
LPPDGGIDSLSHHDSEGEKEMQGTSSMKRAFKAVGELANAAVDSLRQGNFKNTHRSFDMKWQPDLLHRGKCCIPFRATALVAILSLGTAFIQQASAGCLDVPSMKHPTSLKNSESDFGSGRFIKTGFVQVSDEHEEWAPSFFHAPIVGLWAFTYTSKGNLATLGIPDGARIDAGNTLWFADGNEITYSGIRNPIVGATCLGIWKRTGEFTYVLNHIGLSWNPQAASVSPPGGGLPASGSNPGGGPGAPGGPAFIKQYVVLARDGQSYTGTFTINQLETNGKTPASPPIKGTIKAARVTIDTDTQEETP